MKQKKLKAEKREAKRKRKMSKTSGTLAGQHLRIKTSNKYQGDAKKIK